MLKICKYYLLVGSINRLTSELGLINELVSKCGRTWNEGSLHMIDS
jgi:hypothetical protein